MHATRGGVEREREREPPGFMLSGSALDLTVPEIKT